MKKFLSLVLALVMTMSLVTVSAGAEDFTDDSDIVYTEAVDVISALGIVGGYADGSFDPDGSLTRGAAAKIICNLILGSTTASALTADTAPYPDVPVNHTFAGYIAYCKEQGIISGYADGNFKPGNTLTGYAFMKMLLGALGYDAAIEGYTGANWSVNVAKTALSIGLNDGMADSFVGGKAATREEACLFALNTLKARMVEYPNNSTITVGDLTISNSGKAEFVTYGTVGALGATSDDATIAPGGYVEFAERHFPKLVMGDFFLDGVTTDAFECPATSWTYKNDAIGTYSYEADATFIENTTYADVFAEAGLNTTTTFTVYVDGIVANTYDPAMAGAITVSKTEENLKVGAGNGAIIEVYKDRRNVASPDHRICITNTYVGEVIGVEPATAKADRYIELGTLGDIDAYTTPATTDAALANDITFTTDSFEVGDVVTFTYSFKGVDAVKSVGETTSVTGTVKNFTTDKKFTLNEDPYKYGAKKVNIYGTSDVGSTSTVYLDANGFALYTAESVDNIKNYALVLNAGLQSALSGDGYQAWLLYADGTTKIVDTDKLYGEHNTDPGDDADVNLVGEWVTYKTNKDGEVVLSQPTGTYGVNYATDGTSSLGQIYMENGKALIDIGDDAAVTDNTQVNSTSIIIVKNADDEISVYEGIKNMPTIDTDSNNEVYWSYYMPTGSLYAKLLYVEINGTNTIVDNGSDKAIFLVADEYSTVVETDSDMYYVFQAVVDGEIAEDDVMLDATDANTMTVINTLLAGGVNNVVLSSYAEDDGMYTVKASNTTNVYNVASTQTVKKVSGNCIAFNGSAYYTADDCVFYRVDQYGNLSETTINAVRNSTVGGYYGWLTYTLNRDAEITGVYWEYTR